MKLNETKLVILLCVLAGIRVLIFTAAFPFFNNVDEYTHYDMICKFAAGHVPRGMERFSKEAARMMAMYGTRQYSEQWYEWNQNTKPPWRFPYRTVAPLINVAIGSLTRVSNHDSTQFSLYYVVAGGWYDFGKALGIKGGFLLYWLKLVNVPIYILLVWVAHLISRRLYPGNLWLNLGVPAILAFFPQDVFYGLNSDVPSALLAALSLYLLLIYYQEQKGMGFCILAGLSVSAAFLTKIANLPLLLFFGVLLLAKTRQEGGLKRQIPGMIGIVLAAAIPIGAWLLRNQLVLGELTGNHAKMIRMNWTYKPFGELLDHPIFTPRGAIYFWTDLMKTFWRGEIVWYKVHIASPIADTVYVLTSSVFLLAAALAWKRKEERFAGISSFVMLGLSVTFLIGLSMIYDFHNCRYPSSDSPYFTSGRLILGALVPFLMLYLSGLGAILERLGIGNWRWMVLSVLLVLMLGSEIAITGNVFASPYNFYHMLMR